MCSKGFTQKVRVLKSYRLQRKGWPPPGSWGMISEPLECPPERKSVSLCLRLWAMYQFDFWRAKIRVSEVSHVGTACVLALPSIETLDTKDL